MLPLSQKSMQVSPMGLHGKLAGDRHAGSPATGVTRSFRRVADPPAFRLSCEPLTHRDGRGGELVAQSWNAQWAATTAIALRNVRLHLWGFYTICVE